MDRHCKLCDGVMFSKVLSYDVAMTSDSQLMKAPLRKVQCVTCRLISNERDLEASALQDFYENKYTLAESADRAEPVFFFRGERVERSRVIAGWFFEFISTLEFDFDNLNFLEVGCGEGKLLAAMQEKFPCSNFKGLEPNLVACEMARRQRVEVFNCGYDGLPDGKRFDVIYSFAVLEHLPDPSHFLDFMKGHLSPGGVLILCQPCQDSPSHDVYFIDHLYHFHSQHVIEFAKKSGYRSLKKQVGHPLIPAFSMHAFAPQGEVLRPSDLQEIFRGINASSGIGLWEERIENLKKLIDKKSGQKFCVWGVGEVFTLLSIYAGLSELEVVAGFDNNYQRFSGVYRFPVVEPDHDSIQRFSQFTWLLTFKPPMHVLSILNSYNIEYFALVGE